MITTVIIAGLFSWLFYRNSVLDRRCRELDSSYRSLYKEFHELNLYVRGVIVNTRRKNTELVRSKCSVKENELGCEDHVCKTDAFTTKERVDAGCKTRGGFKSEI